jgi:hypothetical protein
VALREQYGPEFDIEVYQPEAYFLLTSRGAELSVEQIAREFRLEPLQDYLARSTRQREEHLRASQRTAQSSGCRTEVKKDCCVPGGQ